MRPAAGVLASLLALAPAAQDPDPRATDLDRKVMAGLRGRHDTPHARLHYDEAGITTAQRDAAAADLEAGVAALEQRLHMRYRGKLLVFLYRDHADLGQRTGSSAVAFSTGTASLHQPHDFRGVHELTHLFAVQFPRTEDSVTDPFVVEGLATILAETDQNVPIHAWAAVYLQVGRLPDLVELRRTFPEGAGPGVHPYHVAGSFVGFLLDRYGIDKVKQWYVESTEAWRWFGKPFRTLEREWRAWLAEVEVEKAHRDHVRARLGVPSRPMPAELWTRPGIDLLAGGSLASFAAEDAGRWRLEQGGVLCGTNDGPWTHLHSEQVFGPEVSVRTRLRLTAGDAVKVQLNRAANGVDEAILAAWSTYVSSGQGFLGNDKVKLAPGVWHDVVFVHERGTCRLYVDGDLVLDAPGAPSQEAGRVGIAVEKGTVEVSRLDVLASTK